VKESRISVGTVPSAMKSGNNPSRAVQLSTKHNAISEFFMIVPDL